MMSRTVVTPVARAVPPQGAVAAVAVPPPVLAVPSTVAIVSRDVLMVGRAGEQVAAPEHVEESFLRVEATVPRAAVQVRRAEVGRPPVVARRPTVAMSQDAVTVMVTVRAGRLLGVPVLAAVVTAGVSVLGAVVAPRPEPGAEPTVVAVPIYTPPRAVLACNVVARRVAPAGRVVTRVVRVEEKAAVGAA